MSEVPDVVHYVIHKKYLQGTDLRFLESRMQSLKMIYRS